MTIKIESVINQWDSETDEVIVRFLNLLTLAKTRRELEQALDFSPFKERHAGNWSRHWTFLLSRSSFGNICYGDGEAVTFG